MKEIDFIPDWYKSGKRRQSSLRTQYLALCSIFVVMVVWSFATGHSLSKAMAKLESGAILGSDASASSVEFLRIKSEVADLRGEAAMLSKMDSRIDVAGVLAEISFLADDNIVLKKVEFNSEQFETTKKSKPKGTSGVRYAGRRSGSDSTVALGAVRFRIVVEGIASSSSAAAKLARSFEDSGYFRDVTSSWEEKELNTGSGDTIENIRVSEFSIVCYLANYEQEIIRTSADG
jgi:hypothetical protein